MLIASSSGWAWTAMRVRGRSGMAGSVGVGARCPGHVCRSPTASASRSSSRGHSSGRRHRAHDELREPDLEELLEHGAQAAAADRDDLLERTAAGPPGQRRRRQRAEVRPLGRVGQADPEVLRADGPPVRRRHPVDHRLARRGVGRACRRPGATRRPGARSARARPGRCRRARRRRDPGPVAARPRRRRRSRPGRRG